MHGQSYVLPILWSCMVTVNSKKTALLSKILFTEDLWGPLPCNSRSKLQWLQKSCLTKLGSQIFVTASKCLSRAMYSNMLKDARSLVCNSGQFNQFHSLPWDWIGFKSVHFGHHWVPLWDIKVLIYIPLNSRTKIHRRTSRISQLAVIVRIHQTRCLQHSLLLKV